TRVKCSRSRPVPRFPTITQAGVVARLPEQARRRIPRNPVHTLNAGVRWNSPIVLGAPFHEVLNCFEIPGLVHAKNQVAHASLEESVALCIAGVLLGAAAALDLVGIAPNLRAPVVQDLHLVGKLFRAAEAMPHIGVLRGEFEGDLLAPTADENGNFAQWFGNVDLPTVLDDLQRPAQSGQARAHRAKVVAVLAVIALEPARANPQDQAAIADVI